MASSASVKSLQEKPRDMLKSGPVRQLWWIAEITLEKLPANDRTNILFDLSKNPDFLTLSAFSLNYCLRQHGFYDKKDEVQEELRWVDEKQLEKLKLQWIDSFTSIIKRKVLFDISDLSHVLFMLRRINPQKAKELVWPLMEKNDDLDKFVRAIGRSGQDSMLFR